MRNDKQLALELRRQGQSYSEISKKLNIPKSTLSEWFSGIGWSVEIKEKLAKEAENKAKDRFERMIRERQKKWEEWREFCRQEARNNFSDLLEDPLFVSGINLYWGEGHSVMQGGRVELANTDPRMIAVFAKFLTKIAQVPLEKIRVWLILYEDLQEEQCKIFWSKASGIPQNQFYKTQFIKGRHKTKRLEYGICEIQTYSRGLKEKIFVWIDMLYNELH